MNAELKTFDLSDDDSRPELSDVWDALDSPVYHVLDEDGVNVAGGQIRRLDSRHWLYCDDTDGYSVLSDDEVGHLIVVKPEDDPRLGWDKSGNVIQL